MVGSAASMGRRGSRDLLNQNLESGLECFSYDKQFYDVSCSLCRHCIINGRHPREPCLLEIGNE